MHHFESADFKSTKAVTKKKKKKNVCMYEKVIIWFQIQFGLVKKRNL